MSPKRVPFLTVFIIFSFFLASQAFCLTAQQLQYMQQLSPEQREALSKLSPQELQALTQQSSTGKSQTGQQFPPGQSQYGQQFPPGQSQYGQMLSPEEERQILMRLSTNQRQTIQQLPPEQRQIILQLSPELRRAILELSPDQRYAILQLSPDQRQVILQLTPDQRQAILQLTPDQRYAILQLSPAQREAIQQLTIEDLQAIRELSEKDLRAIQTLSPMDVKILKGRIPQKFGPSGAPPQYDSSGPPQQFRPSDTPQRFRPSGDAQQLDPFYEFSEMGRASLRARELPLYEPGAEKIPSAGEESIRLDAGELEPFGYDLFFGATSSFAPATDIPVSADYVIGPGDTIQLQLFGKINAEYTLLVNRDGTVQIPEIGPKTLAGLKFSELQNKVDTYVRDQMIGVRASVTMGPLRSIRVFVLGDAIRPGSYTVSALSTMTNALFVSGGIKTIGSLRDIQLKRSGKIIGMLDFYDLLLNGDNSKDLRLQPGDVIFIPPVGTTAGIGGGVKRPGIYELKSGDSVEALVAIAGGLLPTSAKSKAKLDRLAENGDRLVIDIDLTKPSDAKMAVFSGDLLWVGSALEALEDFVRVSGSVQRPGSYQWRQGIRVSDVINSIEDDLKPRSDLNYALVKRQLPPDYQTQVYAFNLMSAVSAPESQDNMDLRPRDEIIVFGIEEDRPKTLAPIIDQLRAQAIFNQPELVVSVEGFVEFPGEYPLTIGMRFSDLAKAAVLKPHTDLQYALVKRDHLPGKPMDVISIQPGAALAASRSPEDIALQAKDKVLVFGRDTERSALVLSIIDELRGQARAGEPEKIAAVTGQVRFPGEYPLSAGMHVTDLIRAGGDLQQKGYNVEAELVRFVVIGEKRRESIRIPIDLAAIANGDTEKDVLIEPFDTLTIKQVIDWREILNVEVLGEVNFPGIYVAKHGDTLTELIKRAGGFNDRAFLNGAVFVREDLRMKEQQQLDQLRDRLRSDLAAIQLQKAQEDPRMQEALGSMQGILSQLESTKAVGRLVIDMESIINGVSDDITLQNGDKIFVPDKPQEVTVIGEVYYPTSHLFSSRFSRNDYISRSGGYTVKADKSRIYVVKANGEVIAPSGGWFGSGQQSVAVGDTIVVPLDAERIKPLFLWSSVAQIVYQASLAVAAFNAVGVF